MFRLTLTPVFCFPNVLLAECSMFNIFGGVSLYVAGWMMMCCHDRIGCVKPKSYGVESKLHAICVELLKPENKRDIPNNRVAEYSEADTYRKHQILSHQNTRRVFRFGRGKKQSRQSPVDTQPKNDDMCKFGFEYVRTNNPIHFLSIVPSNPCVCDMCTELGLILNFPIFRPLGDCQIVSSDISLLLDFGLKDLR